MRFNGLMRGAICGTLTAIGSVMCILATELPAVPHDMDWRIIGWIMVCAGVWPMAYTLLKEVER